MRKLNLAALLLFAVVLAMVLAKAGHYGFSSGM
jgi:hypothetical protein